MGEQPFLNNAGKDGSHVVEVTTYNRDHLAFQDDTYVVKYIGTYDIGAYADDVVLSYTSAEYTGSALKPEVTIPGLQEGVDYTVAYQNNVNPGEATVVITGIGSYEGSITKTFTITEKGGTENPPDEGETDPSKPGSGEDGGSDSPNTGDDSQLSLWLTLMLVSGGALTFIVRRRTDK